MKDLANRSGALRRHNILPFPASNSKRRLAPAMRVAVSLSSPRARAALSSFVLAALLVAGSAVPGTAVAEVVYRGVRWSRERRLILIRHHSAEKKRPGGKRLLDCPGYAYQALFTSLPPQVSPIAVWRDYNGRAGVENVIKELVHGFGLPHLCCESFSSERSGFKSGHADLQT